MLQYGLAFAVAMLALAAAVRAEVVYRTPAPDPLGLYGFSQLTYDVDLDGDGHADLTAQNANYSSSPFATGHNAFLYSDPSSGGSATFVESPALDAAPLSAGTAIGPANTYGAYASTQIYGWVDNRQPFGPPTRTTNGNARWADGEPHFIGFRFQSGGHTHYGWIELSVTTFTGQSQPAGQPETDQALNIFGWAWETTPDTAIVAGVVPEPTIALLLVLTAPALLRRRLR